MDYIKHARIAWWLAVASFVASGLVAVQWQSILGNTGWALIAVAAILLGVGIFREWRWNRKMADAMQEIADNLIAFHLERAELEDKWANMSLEQRKELLLEMLMWSCVTMDRQNGAGHAAWCMEAHLSNNPTLELDRGVEINFLTTYVIEKKRRQQARAKLLA